MGKVEEDVEGHEVSAFFLFLLMLGTGILIISMFFRSEATTYTVAGVLCLVAVCIPFSRGLAKGIAEPDEIVAAKPADKEATISKSASSLLNDPASEELENESIDYYVDVSPDSNNNGSYEAKMWKSEDNPYFFDEYLY